MNDFSLRAEANKDIITVLDCTNRYCNDHYKELLG